MISSSEVERTTLGMCMQPEHFERALALGLHPGIFQDPAHQKIFQAMLESDKAGQGIDVAALAVRIPQHARDMVEIREQAPLAQNFEPYAEEVLALARQRQVYTELTSLSKAVLSRSLFDPASTIDRLVEETLIRLMAKASHEQRGPKKIDQVLDEVLPAIEQQVLDRREGKLLGVPTGFAVLDVLTGGGFFPGTINVAAARTGRGKTTLAVNFLHTAAMAGRAAAYFTVEMPTGEILRKLLSLSGGINGTALRIGELGERDFDKLWEAQKRLYQKPIWFDDSTGARFEELEAACRRLKRQGPLDLIVVDYIQQFTCAGHWKSAHERLTAVSHKLKQLALSLDIAVVALAQLNREAEKGEGQPDVWHIKDSGAIEQDADLVLLIHHLDSGTKLFVGKNRNGKDRLHFPVEANLAFNAFKNVTVNMEAYK